MLKKLNSYRKKALQFHHDRGLKALFIKIYTLALFKCRKWAKRNIKTMRSKEDLFYASYKNAEPLSYITVKAKAPRLNLVIDNLKSEVVSSSRSLILCALYAAKNHMPLRIISRSIENHPSDFFNFLQLRSIPKPVKVEFFSDFDREIRKRPTRMEVSEQDQFFVNSWRSAQAIEACNFRKSYFYLTEKGSSFNSKEEQDFFERRVQDPFAMLLLETHQTEQILQSMHEQKLNAIF